MQIYIFLNVVKGLNNFFTIFLWSGNEGFIFHLPINGQAWEWAFTDLYINKCIKNHINIYQGANLIELGYSQMYSECSVKIG